MDSAAKSYLWARWLLAYAKRAGGTLKKLLSAVRPESNTAPAPTAPAKTVSQGGTGIYNNSIGGIIDISQMMPEDRITMDTSNDLAKYGVSSVKPSPSPTAPADNTIWLWASPGNTAISSSPMSGWEKISSQEARRRGMI